MNARIPPEFYVASASYAWFVEGFTSDDPRDWQLMVAERDFNGAVSMATVQSGTDLGPMLDTPWPGRVPSQDELNKMTLMIGNTQRLLKGIPFVKVIVK